MGLAADLKPLVTSFNNSSNSAPDRIRSDNLRGRDGENLLLVGADTLSVGEDVDRRGIPTCGSDSGVEASVAGCSAAKIVC